MKEKMERPPYIFLALSLRRKNFDIFVRSVDRVYYAKVRSFAEQSRNSRLGFVKSEPSLRPPHIYLRSVLWHECGFDLEKGDGAERR